MTDCGYHDQCDPGDEKSDGQARIVEEIDDPEEQKSDTSSEKETQTRQLNEI